MGRQTQYSILEDFNKISSRQKYPTSFLSLFFHALSFLHINSAVLNFEGKKNLL